MKRVVLYWFLGLVLVSQIVLCWQILNGPDRPFFEHFHFDILWTERPSVVIASLLLLPIVLIDTLVLTNRFAGPIYRLRSSMRALAAGERVDPVRFRDHDFWQEIAQEFNTLSAYVEQLKKQAASASASQTAATEAKHDLEPVVTD